MTYARTRIKVCCISSLEEAALAVRHGADAIGLVANMPSGPGVIEEALIARIAPRVPPPVATFLLTSEQQAEGIIAQHGRCRTSVIQICDHVAAGTYAALRAGLPGVKLVQVVHVADDDALEEALSAAPQVDAILLDSGNQKLAVKELGGTGRVHDWGVSRKIVERSPAPVFLAGGLRPENVAEAIAAVRPYGVDVCSGLRTDGRLDERKLAAFVEAVSG